MRKILLIPLALLLGACGLVQPVEQQQPTPVIATVLVTVIAPTEVVPPTAVPLPTQAPTQPPTEVPTSAPTETLVPTSAPQPTEVLPTLAASASSDITPVSVDIELGKGVFKDITFSSDLFSLRCFPREVSINITANLPEIVDAIMYYRIVDNPNGLYPSEWQNAGEMESDKKGNFSIVFTGLDVNPNLRLDKAWMDVQFIGINKGGGVVDRTQKIERLITFLKECP